MMRMMIPMTQQEYEKQKSIIRQVYDVESGCYRSVRGTGEIIESIVTKEQHERINRIATAGDGSSFVRQILKKADTNS